jgi:hypothetical protein
MKIGFKKILDAFHHLLNHFTNRSGARNSGRSMKKLGPPASCQVRMRGSDGALRNMFTNQRNKRPSTAAT